MHQTATLAIQPLPGYSLPERAASSCGSPRTLPSVPPVFGFSQRLLSVASEFKFDGFRGGARLRAGRVRLESRRNNDLTARFPDVAAAVKRLAAENALLDGKIAVLMPDGRTSFQALQHRSNKTGVVVYMAFDLIHLNDENVGGLPLAERKARLEELVAREAANGVIRYTPHIVGDGPRILARACELGVEGIVCKRLDASYRPGRVSGRDWLKYKCLRTEPFVVGGFTAGRNSVSALLVGEYDATGALHYVGSVGTGSGFTRDFLRELYVQLVQIEQTQSPFVGFAPRIVRSPWTRSSGAVARWVQPAAVVDVAYLEKTVTGQLRHASFQRFVGTCLREASSGVEFA